MVRRTGTIQSLQDADGWDLLIAAGGLCSQISPWIGGLLDVVRMLHGGFVSLIRRFFLGLLAASSAFWRSDSGNGCACEAGVSKAATRSDAANDLARWRMLLGLPCCDAVARGAGPLTQKENSSDLLAARPLRGPLRGNACGLNASSANGHSKPVAGAAPVFDLIGVVVGGSAAQQPQNQLPFSPRLARRSAKRARDMNSGPGKDDRGELDTQTRN